jgi:integrase
MYSLRHALASDLTNANVATEIVRQAMGHASIQTTQRYANKGGLQAVANALTQVRGGSLVAVSENGLRTQEEDFGT